MNTKQNGDSRHQQHEQNQQKSPLQESCCKVKSGQPCPMPNQLHLAPHEQDYGACMHLEANLSFWELEFPLEKPEFQKNRPKMSIPTFLPTH